MPDLDNELTTVRAETRAIIEPPDFENVVRRTNRQSARRRSIVAFAAVALVLVILVPLLQSREITPAGLTGNVVAIDFADQTHGYALLTDCLVTESHRPECLWRLEGTRDGVTWLPRTVPPVTGTPGMQLQVLGKDTVVLTEAGIRWLSKDGARSWRRLPNGLASPVDSIPAGADMYVGCTDWKAADCDKPRVLVTLPENGAVAPLVNQPPVNLDTATAQPVPAADGSWWVYAQDPATSQMTLATTRDDGRTWIVSHPPKDPSDDLALIDEITVVSGNGVLYGLGHGLTSSVPGTPSSAFFAFYRSTDGGRSWEMTYNAGRPRVIHSVSSTPVLTSAGDIIVSTPDGPQRALVSRDGGRSFQPAAQPELNWVSWTRAGYINTRTGPTPTHWLSTDGITWRRLGEG